MAKKRTLRYILLGLLNDNPMTGYELNQSFRNEIGEFWQAKHSQIYPELIKMEKDGLISHKIEIAGTKLEKKCYSITEKGRAELNSWVNLATEELPVNRDEFVVKLYFIKDATDPALYEVVENQLKLHEERLSHLEDRKRLIFDSSKKIEANFGHFLILDHGINREKEYVDWLKKIQSQINER
ncbi:PadR family transcriptional regulator [Enterococcus sp. AZ192]|uniref:PadR family transcriptional regulator n=1 Tax=unclassified Enterococcus TaxID=2608891 RepID=UPI003D2D49F3